MEAMLEGPDECEPRKDRFLAEVFQLIDSSLLLNVCERGPRGLPIPSYIAPLYGEKWRCG